VRVRWKCGKTHRTRFSNADTSTLTGGYQTLRQTILRFGAFHPTARGRENGRYVQHASATGRERKTRHRSASNVRNGSKAGITASDIFGLSKAPLCYDLWSPQSRTVSTVCTRFFLGPAPLHVGLFHVRSVPERTKMRILKFSKIREKVHEGSRTHLAHESDPKTSESSTFWDGSGGGT
jgi:hypothetical protein